MEVLICSDCDYVTNTPYGCCPVCGAELEILDGWTMTKKAYVSLDQETRDICKDLIKIIDAEGDDV